MTEKNVCHHKRVMRRSFNLDTNKNSHMQENPFSIFNANQQQQQRLNDIRKKPERLMCSICQGPAHGYNFDAITCESCKAFFRRNALKFNDKLKCRVNGGQCVITISTRKRCKACRLAKCFEKGMRADWILTDEERTNKRQKIEDNRRLRQMLYPDSPRSDEIQPIEPKNESCDIEEDDDTTASSFITPSTSSPPISFLSSKDLIKIEQIEQAYRDSVRLTSLSPEIPSYPYTTRLSEASDMINFAENIHAIRLITYFKLLPEFCSLNEYDKLILIKHNTFALSFVRAALNYNPLTDIYHEPNTDDCVFEGRDLIQCFSLYQYQQSTRCLCNLLNSSLGDRFLLKALLIIMLLSKGSSICTFSNETEPLAQDLFLIYHTQNVFIELLWKYCETKHGFTRTINIWLKLTMSYIDAHLQAYNTRHSYVKVDSVADQLSPLMKSIMLII